MSNGGGMILLYQEGIIMEDILLKKKRQLLKVASNKKYARKEKYEDIKEIISELNIDEKSILQNEFKRDYDFFITFEGSKSLVSNFVALIGLLLAAITAFDVFWIQKYFFLCVFVIFILVVIVLNVLEVIYKNKRKYLIKYILDIFNELMQ